MTTPSALPVDTPEVGTITVTGPQGLVAAIPPIVGFCPDNSVVVMCLTEPRGRLGPVARADLSDLRHADAMRQLVNCADRYADAVALVCYDGGGRPAGLDDLIAGIGERGIPIHAVLSVQGGLIRDARSTSAMRQDPGIPMLDPSDNQSVALRGAAAVSGRSPLPSRAALAASIAPPMGRGSGAMRRLIERARTRVPQGPCGDGIEAGSTVLWRAQVAAVDDALGAAVADHTEGGAVEDAVAARVIALSERVECRDLLLARSIRWPDASIVGTLIAIVAWCPQGLGTNLCAVLAATAYRFGDGALAQCALDRAEAADPDNRLVRLLRVAATTGIPPGELDTLADIALPAGATPVPGAAGAPRRSGPPPPPASSEDG